MAVDTETTETQAKRPGEGSYASHASKKSKSESYLPDIGIDDDSQLPAIKDIINDCADTIKSCLQLDKQVSKKTNFTYTKEDKSNYLVVPSNLRDLMKIAGWNALFSLLITLGVRLKQSETPLDKPVASEEVSSFIAGLANRIKFIQTTEEDIKIKVTGSTPKERGRCAVDILLTKQITQQVNLERFLPETSSVQGRSFMRYYLSILGGAEGLSMLKSVPDLINTLIKECTRSKTDQLRKAVDEFKIPSAVAIDDLLRKKSETRKINGKNVKVSKPIQFSKISNTPFCLDKREQEFFEGLEKPWEDLKGFALDFKEGIKINDLVQARQTFKTAYDAKIAYVQKFSSWKNRRLKAYKDLAAYSIDKKSMENWRLSDSSKQAALDNLPGIMKESIEKKDRSLLKSIIANLNPNKIPGFNMNNTIWSSVNADTALQSVGLVPYYDSKQRTTMEEIFELLKDLTPEMATITTEPADPSKRKKRNRNTDKEDRTENQYEPLVEEDDEMDSDNE